MNLCDTYYRLLMTVEKRLITQPGLFYTLPVLNWLLLNNEFVTPAMYVNKFKGVIIA